MEAMRDILRGNLARSLRGVGDEDRLAAAWSVACGRAMAERGTVVGYDAGVVHVQVADAVWMHQMVSLRSVLAREMAEIAALPVTAIHFELKKN
jgi:hypothetical protein